MRMFPKCASGAFLADIVLVMNKRCSIGYMYLVPIFQ